LTVWGVGVDDKPKDEVVKVKEKCANTEAKKEKEVMIKRNTVERPD